MCLTGLPKEDENEENERCGFHIEKDFFKLK